MIINADLFFTNFIYNLPHNLILDSFFGFFSIKGMSLLIWVAIFAYLVFFEEKKHKEFVIFFISGLLISSFLANIVIKNIVHRPRPHSVISNQQSAVSSNTNLNANKLKTDNRLLTANYPADFSFPSGHAATSFAAATILAYFDKKRKKVFYIIAFLIAFSRVYLGYHYFFDVVFGAFLGWLISWLILRFRYKTTLRV